MAMAFSPPVVGCLVKKGVQKGGSRAPQDPPGYALGEHVHKKPALYIMLSICSLEWFCSVVGTYGNLDSSFLVARSLLMI